MVKTVRGIKVHPAADIMPMVDDEKWEVFVESVRRGVENSTLQNIELLDGQILDGRNRWVALTEIGVNPQDYCVDVTGLVEDPVQYVLDKNLDGRRQVKAGQLGMIAAKIANLPVGYNGLPKGSIESEMLAKKKPSDEISIDEAAKRLGVSRSTVKTAKQVLAKGSSAVVSKVDRGEISLGEAKKIVDHIPEKSKQADIANLEKEERKQKIAEVVEEKHKKDFDSAKPGSRGSAEGNEKKKSKNKSKNQSSEPQSGTGSSTSQTLGTDSTQGIQEGTQSIAGLEQSPTQPDSDRWDVICDQLQDSQLIDLVNRIFIRRPEVAKAFDFVSVSSDMVTEVVDAWNRIMKPEREVKATKSRLSTIKVRLRNKDWCDNWLEALTKLSTCDFANGANDRGWKADIDFFLRPDTIWRVLEGKYDSSRGKTGRAAQVAGYGKSTSELAKEGDL